MTVQFKNRIASIDVLRAITMLLMIFVNDIPSLKDIPQWLEHVKRNVDGMGLSDVVFPAFLFITGMSVPFAVNSRREKGDSQWEIMLHVVERSLALLVMGLFLINGEYLNEAATGMSRNLWNSLCCIAFILVWNDWAKLFNVLTDRIIKTGGILLLLILVWLCRGGEGQVIMKFTTYWWGILGLIGWAYFACAILFTVSGNRYIIPFIALTIFILGGMASIGKWIDKESYLLNFLKPLGNGAHAALVMAGIITGMTYQKLNRKGNNLKLVLTFVAGAILFIAAGFAVRSFGGISKIRATPSWALICSGITILFFLLVHWLVDVKGKEGWFKVIRPAGNNTLLCYLVPYFAYALMKLVHLHFPKILGAGIPGLLKSFVFSLLIVWITGGLGKIGIRLRL